MRVYRRRASFGRSSRSCSRREEVSLRWRAQETRERDVERAPGQRDQAVELAVANCKMLDKPRANTPEQHLADFAEPTGDRGAMHTVELRERVDAHAVDETLPKQ